MMLVTKALSQDVTHLAFVPLAKEEARRSPAESERNASENNSRVTVPNEKSEVFNDLLVKYLAM